VAEAQAQNQGEAAPDAGQNQTQPKKDFSLLAREAFGTNFHGEVTETPPAESEPNASQQQAAEDDAPSTPEAAPDADADATEDDAQKAEGDQGISEGDKPDADADADKNNEVQNFAELIETLEAEPDWFQALPVDVTVNGKPSQVPFRDLVANYQMNQAAEAKLEQAKTKSQEAQQVLAQKTAAVEAQFATAGAIVQQAEQVLTAEFENVDWNALHEDDPAAWSAEKVKFQERRGQIEQLKQQLTQQYQHSVAQRQHEQTAQQQQFLAEQAELMAQVMPKISADWGREETLPTAKARLTDYLLKQGFTQDDINTAADHRLLAMAEKARLHDEAKGKVDVQKKRLRTVPKVIKPGTPKPQSQVNLEQVGAAQKRLLKSGRVEDAVALLRAKRKG